MQDINLGISKLFISTSMGYRLLISTGFRSVRQEFHLPRCFMANDGLFVWKHLLLLLLLLLEIFNGVGVYDVSGL